jgi:large subunit ribosomal protein L16
MKKKNRLLLKNHKGKKYNKIKPLVDIKKINFNKILLISKEFGRITSNQFKTIKNIIRKRLKKKGIFKFNFFPQKKITKKPSEIRMGKGKGSFSDSVFNLKAGINICEIRMGIKNNSFHAYIGLKKAILRLPVKIKIIRI